MRGATSCPIAAPFSALARLFYLLWPAIGLGSAGPVMFDNQPRLFLQPSNDLALPDLPEIWLMGLQMGCPPSPSAECRRRRTTDCTHSPAGSGRRTAQPEALDTGSKSPARLRCDEAMYRCRRYSTSVCHSAAMASD